MIWRRAIGLLGGLLLALPLALLLGSLSSAWLRPAPPSPELSPVLSLEQRRQLTTYRHACRTSTDCEPPLACLLDTRIDRLQETPRISNCAIVHGPPCDREPCPQGQQCAIWHGMGGATLEVWMQCVPPCDEARPSCPEGSVCYYGFCYRPCQPDTPDACGPDARCIFFAEHWLCAPSG